MTQISAAGVKSFRSKNTTIRVFIFGFIYFPGRISTNTPGEYFSLMVGLSCVIKIYPSNKSKAEKRSMKLSSKIKPQRKIPEYFSKAEHKKISHNKAEEKHQHFPDSDPISCFCSSVLKSTIT